MTVRKFLWAAALLTALAALACRADPAELFQKAEAHRKLGRTEEAVKEYRKVIELEPGNMKAHLGLGLALLERGKKAEGEKSLENAVKLGGSTDELAEANYRLGDIALEEGDPQKALDYYKKVPAVEPQKILDTRILIVKKELSGGDADRGVDMLLNLLNEFPNNPSIEAVLDDPAAARAKSRLFARFIADAKEHIKKDEFKQAEASLEKSEKFAVPASKNDTAQLWAVIRSETGECEKAAQLWDDITATAEDIKAKADFYAIVCKMKTGKALEALNSFEAMTDDDPSHDEAAARIPEALRLIETKRFKVSLERVNIRSGPSTKTDILDKWKLTDEVRVVEKVNKNWYRINFKGERSAYAHKSIISDKPLAVVVKKNGWEKVKGEGWMLAFRPYVEMKLANLSEKPIGNLRLRMVVRQGSKKLSDDTFKVDVSPSDPLEPDKTALASTPANVKVELLTRPGKATVNIYVSINDSDFELYRQFGLNRDVVDVVEEGG